MFIRSLFACGLGGLCSALLSASCVTVEANAPVVPVSVVESGSLPIALARAKRVALHPRGRMVRVADEADAAGVRVEIERSIADSLTGLGYVFASIDRADCLIAYAIGVTGELDDEELQRAYGISAGMRMGDSNDRGAIVLSVTRRDARHATWRASASGDGSPDAMPDVTREDRIRGAIQQLLSGAPRAGRRL